MMGSLLSDFWKPQEITNESIFLYDPSHFVLQQLDYIEYIDHYHQFIKSFHVKDSEFKPNGKKGAFGGYGDWIDRAGRYRSPGDGQIDFKTIFTKLTEYGCDCMGSNGMGVLHQKSRARR